MKKWFVTNKSILVFFGFITVITTLVTMIEVNMIMDHMKELQQYATDQIITEELKKIGMFGLLNISLIALWSFLLAFLVYKIFIPNKKVMRAAFCIDELEYLRNLPDQLRRELDR